MNENETKASPNTQSQPQKDQHKSPTFIEEESIDKDAISLLLQKNEEKNALQKPIQEKTISQQITIQSLEDVLFFTLEKGYDFFVFEPQPNNVYVSYKKSGIVKEKYTIPYHIYYQILIEAKKNAHLQIENTQHEQIGKGSIFIKDKPYETTIKTVPSSFGEILYGKAKEKIITQTKKKKQTVSFKTLIAFLGALFVSAIVIGGTFLAFVILNAKTPNDVSFFRNLGISLSEVNAFLLKATNFIFTSLVIIETLLITFFLLKFFLTRKEQKKQRTAWMLLSIFGVILLFGTGTFWLYLYKTINNLPNWQEMAYGNIQLYDNSILLSGMFPQTYALIDNTTKLIAPVTIKFDVKYLQREEAKKGFEIKKYIWNFGDGTREETLTPEIIHTYQSKGNFKVTLSLVGIDERNPDQETTKEVNTDIILGIPHSISVEEKKLSNGGKEVKFNASEFQSIGKVRWYMGNEKNPVYEGYVFHPQKIFFNKEVIQAKIYDASGKVWGEKIFTIAGQETNIKGNIVCEVSVENDLAYTCKVVDIQNAFGEGFIESFTWNIENKVYTKKSNRENLEESSQVMHEFSSYGKKTIYVTLTNSNQKTKTFEYTIDVPRKAYFSEMLEIYAIENEEKKKIQNVFFDIRMNEYLLNIEAPQTLVFDTSSMKTKEYFYTIDSIQWDINGDNIFDKEGKSITQDFLFPGNYTLFVKIKLKHKKKQEDTFEVIHKISIEAKQKDIVVYFDMRQESEYAPTKVFFDASLTKVQDDSIVKFIYDYGDGIIEEGGSVNQGHLYTAPGNYTVKLTIQTKKGKTYVATRTLVLKPEPTFAKIVPSLKKAPVGQEIYFSSTKSQGQIVSYHWDFGDGNYSTEPNPTHAFSSPGKYTVTLTVEFTNKNVKSDSVEIEITQKE